jgi:catechol 2,3-dioxygenase-like lactoylglutathione lyase family enzyme
VRRRCLPHDIRGLDHAIIAVSDWDRSTAFYRDVLGADVIDRGDGLVCFRLGETQLNVHGPGFFPDTNVARLPVRPGNSDRQRFLRHRPPGPGRTASVKPSHAYDPDLHETGSVAASGRCSHHEARDGGPEGCSGAAVVSFEDHPGHWQAGCARALAELVETGDIEPLGQGA